jgi:hypothetical protein
MDGFWGPTSSDALTLRIAADFCERSGNPGDATRLRKMVDRQPLRWESLRPSPLHILLSHSDCDGEIKATDCAPIADALEALLPRLDGEGGGYVGDFKRTQTFIDGLRAAAAAGEDVEFH